MFVLMGVSSKEVMSIMRKINKKNIEMFDIKDSLCVGVYHEHDWDGGFEDNDNGYRGSQKEYYEDLEYMVDS